MQMYDHPILIVGMSFLFDTEITEYTEKTIEG